MVMPLLFLSYTDQQSVPQPSQRAATLHPVRRVHKVDLLLALQESDGDLPGTIEKITEGMLLASLSLR